jgi:hypothetical protein
MADEQAGGGTTQTTADSNVDTILTGSLPEGDAMNAAVKAGADGGSTNTEAGKEGAKPDGAGGAKPEDTKGAEVPEVYEFKLPEGMTLDAPLLEKVTPIFKAKGFTQAEAQGIVDVYAEQIAAQATAQQEAWKGQLATWQQEIKTDAEFGGDKYPATVKAAQTVIARYGDDQLKKELVAFGVGNMPSLIKLLARAGNDMAEDKFLPARPATDDAGDARRLFPSMPNR